MTAGSDGGGADADADAGRRWVRDQGAVEHRIPVDGGSLRAIEIPVHGSSCTPVVFCHGFPGSWFSWRHQLPALAAQGRRAIALDMRGYGGSVHPHEVAAYDRRTTVDDMRAVLDALGIDRAVFSGHDFGAALAWDLPLWLPERVAGLVQLAVPRLPRSPMRPSEAFAMLAREHFFHQHYFQEPGVADAELDAAPREFLHRLFHALGGQGDYYACWRRPGTDASGRPTGYIVSLPEAPPLPWAWLTEDEFGYYVDEFTRSGFTGGLQWYRAQDRVWEQNARFGDAPVTVPTAFVAGAEDPVLTMLGTRCLDAMAATVPGLVRQELIAGAGHFVQMEAPQEVNALIAGFLRGHVDA